MDSSWSRELDTTDCEQSEANSCQYEPRRRAILEENRWFIEHIVAAGKHDAIVRISHCEPFDSGGSEIGLLVTEGDGHTKGPARSRMGSLKGNMTVKTRTRKIKPGE